MSKKLPPTIPEDLNFQLRTLLSSTSGMLEIAAVTEDPMERAQYYQNALVTSREASTLLNRSVTRSPSLDKGPDEIVSGPVNSAHQPQNPREASLNILLAEDNRINQKIVGKLLERRGHTVTVVENGQLAVDSAASNQFDLILMDIKMPVMDGLDAASFIRSDECKNNKPRVPIIAITAVGEVELSMISEFMDDVIQKPFDTKRFITTVDLIADKKSKIQIS